jgi:lysosomal alpha-mannosidase
VGGGWVQADEATVEYYNQMENLEAGWQFLEETFGVRPHVGWQLDPFGYASYTPSLLEKQGFDTLFITRIGSLVKDNLRENGHLRFIWRGHDSDKGVFVNAI